MPVTLPSGWARLSNQARHYWVDPTPRRYDGNRFGGVFGRLRFRQPCGRHNYIYLEAHQLGCKLRGAVGFPLGISVYKDDVLSFYVAKFTQSPPKFLETSGGCSSVNPC
jgi:hypothetical protein